MNVFQKFPKTTNTPKEWFLSKKGPQEGVRGFIVAPGHFHERVGESPRRYENFSFRSYARLNKKCRYKKICNSKTLLLLKLYFGLHFIERAQCIITAVTAFLLPGLIISGGYGTATRIDTFPADDLSCNIPPFPGYGNLSLLVGLKRT